MIEIEHDDTVTLVQIQHGKANALDLALSRALQATFADLASDTRAVVLTGAGTIFSAGVDLVRLLEEGPEYARDLVHAVNGFSETMFGFPRPLVTAVNGHAIAGGCVVACMADRRLMGGDGRIGIPELLVGVPFPAGPLEVMRFAVPQPHFATMVYTGATYTAAEAVERGVIDEVVPSGDLRDRALDEAQRLAAIAPEAFRVTKALVRGPYLAAMRSGAAAAGDVEAAWTGDETRALIRQYVERTFKRAGS